MVAIVKFATPYGNKWTMRKNVVARSLPTPQPPRQQMRRLRENLVLEGLYRVSEDLPDF